jgi:phenylacetate-CoA ligase
VKVYSLSSIVALARAGSPFYRRLYAHLPDDPALTDLPVLDQAAFWSAHQRDRREVLAAPLTDAMVLNSGGSTGAPKFSYLTEEECKWNVEIAVRSFDAGLKDGDRVANLFVAGALHASYLYASDLLRAARADILHLPIGALTPLPDSARLIREFDVNVLTGIPTPLIKLVEYLEQEGLGDVRIRSIIYAGEGFSEAQCAYVSKLFPGVEIHSAGYASVDVGAMAYADEGCIPGEHRVFDDATILEILDEETEEPIAEADRPGKVVFTNLARRLMPIIRYPAGDRAVWLEPPGTPQRKFRLLGRTAEEIKLAGGVLIRVGDVRAVLEPFREPLGIGNLQILLTTEEGGECLTLRLVGGRGEAALRAASPAVLEALKNGHPMWAKLAAAGGARIEWIGQQELIVSPRTVKTLTVVDRRAAAIPK